VEFHAFLKLPPAVSCWIYMASERVEMERIALVAVVQTSSAEEIQLCASAAAFCRRRIIRIPLSALADLFFHFLVHSNLVRESWCPRPVVSVESQGGSPFVWKIAVSSLLVNLSVRCAHLLWGHQKFYDCAGGRTDGRIFPFRAFSAVAVALRSSSSLAYLLRNSIRNRRERDVAQRQLNSAAELIQLICAHNAFRFPFYCFLSTAEKFFWALLALKCIYA
jgi:hypothetical protein